MSRKSDFPIILIATLVMVLSCAALGYDVNKVPPFVTDVNAPQPTVGPPTKPPWTWSEAPGAEPFLAPGDHAWIGSYNFYDPNREKEMHISWWAAKEGIFEAESAVGYKPDGSTVTGTISDPNGWQHPDLDRYYIEVRFDIQPAWEAVKIKNVDANSHLVGDIKIHYICWKPTVMGYACDLYSCSVDHPENSGEITQLLFTHSWAVVDQNVIPQLSTETPGDTWEYTYVTADPCSGESIPQGAWHWNCLVGDGISPGELFDISMSVTECMPEGSLLLSTYDRVWDEWVTFEAVDDEPTRLPPDIAGDCGVDYHDLAALAADWLRGVD